MSDPVSTGGFFRVEGFQLRVWPLLVVILLGVGIHFLSSVVVDAAEHFAGLPERPEMPWVAFAYGHVAQLVLALIAIGIVKPFVHADFGLHGADGKSYLGAALFWGLLFAVLIAAVDYWPQILSHRHPAERPYPLTALNVTGWLSYQGVLAGPSDEIFLRGLLVTFLAANLPGRIGLWRYEMSVAGVLVAAMVALTHVVDFFTKNVLTALGELVLSFLFGVLLAYWFEKSRSLWAPIVGHSVEAMAKIALVFAMVAVWHYA
jgi:uncharacterized protein